MFLLPCLWRLYFSMFLAFIHFHPISDDVVLGYLLTGGIFCCRNSSMSAISLLKDGLVGTKSSNVNSLSVFFESGEIHYKNIATVNYFINYRRLKHLFILSRENCPGVRPDWILEMSQLTTNIILPLIIINKYKINTNY